MEKTKFRVKGILMDLDGTIVDSKRAYLEAVKTALASTGQKTLDIKVVTEIPKRIEQNLPIDDMLVGIDAHKFLQVYLDAYYDATMEKTKPLPNISETLERLSCKAKLALITMRHVPKGKVIEELERLDLAKYFQNVVTAFDTKHPKPSPEALLQCASKMFIQINDCLIVGDSITDIRAGKSAGAVTVGVLSGIYSREELEKEKPDLILKSVNFLPDFLE
jgi:HAD superfamily hydrolase (TIGR01509 family)